MTPKQKMTIIMTQNDIQNAISKFASTIISDFPDLNHLAIVGIRTGGAHLSERLVNKIQQESGTTVESGILDITLYRDDLALDKKQPIVRQTKLPSKISDKIIILTDDVLYTGRTVRAALDAIIDFGRPTAIRLAVIIDRGLREFPIRPDYCGNSIKTTQEQKIRVELTEEGYSEDRVIVIMED